MFLHFAEERKSYLAYYRDIRIKKVIHQMRIHIEFLDMKQNMVEKKSERKKNRDKTNLKLKTEIFWRRNGYIR